MDKKKFMKIAATKPLDKVLTPLALELIKTCVNYVSEQSAENKAIMLEMNAIMLEVTMINAEGFDKFNERKNQMFDMLDLDNEINNIFKKKKP